MLSFKTWILAERIGKTEKDQYDDGTITAVLRTHARDWDPAQDFKKVFKGQEGRELQVARKLNVHVKGAASGSAAGDLTPISRP